MFIMALEALGLFAFGRVWVIEPDLAHGMYRRYYGRPSN